MYESLYLHIPFCKKRCYYCDFTTEALAQEDPAMDEYLSFLISEIRQAAKRKDLTQIRTIYLGGGTPTHLGLGRLVELAYLLSLNIKLEQVQEYTLEANPESLTAAMVNDLFALGVNRLSLGVQSFVDSELQMLGRIHDAATAVRAVTDARGRFDNLSLDLMCGIPGQTTSSWQYSLDKALSLMPEHLSIYPLQIEEGTPLADLEMPMWNLCSGVRPPNLLDSAQTRDRAPQNRGQTPITDLRQGTGLCPRPAPGSAFEVDEDLQAELMELAATFLKAHGYHRYEVASYAKPGFESKHNTAYWSGIPYLGLGRGAASMVKLPDGTRERREFGQETEILSAKEASAEDLFLAMRMARGVNEDQLSKASILLPQAYEVFEELIHLGLVEHTDNTFKPTTKGWLMGNELYARLWELKDL